MKTIIEVKKFFTSAKIELYNGSKDMPIDRWQEFNKLSMRHIGVGSTIEDFNNHFDKLHKCLAAEKTKEAIQEMKNLFQGYFNAINKVSMWSYLICPFIKAIDGIEYPVDDLPKCHEITKLLIKKGVTPEHCSELVEEVKKKLLASCPVIFLPDLMNQEELMSTTQY